MKELRVKVVASSNYKDLEYNTNLSIKELNKKGYAIENIQLDQGVALITYCINPPVTLGSGLSIGRGVNLEGEI